MVRKPQKLFVKFVAQQCSRLEANKIADNLLLRLVESKNFSSVFAIFRRNYKLVPLEVFHKSPYKTLISTLLSSRTNDDTTLAASLRLFAKAPNLKDLRKLDHLTIQKLIYPVGFYKVKSKHISKLANLISSVPKTREELMVLPGVGRKTANLVLNRAFGKPAIAVDTHVHRISNMLGWVKTTTPEKTELELIKILPEKYWSDMNRLFVSIGRQYTSKKKLEEFLQENKLI